MLFERDLKKKLSHLGLKLSILLGLNTRNFRFVNAQKISEMKVNISGILYRKFERLLYLIRSKSIFITNIHPNIEIEMFL